MLALQMHENSRCPGCGHDRARAWHPDMDGWYEAKHYRCAACSEMRGEPVHYTDILDEREPDAVLPDVALEVVPAGRAADD